MCLTKLMAIVLLAATQEASVQPGGADGILKATEIDTAPKEHLRALRVDTMGRLFVGEREALFVYEPNARGGFQARQLLYRFPPNSWLNDIEIRGHDLYVLTATALYVIPDGARKRDNLQPRRLLWGVPSTGALRSLAWGPEGDLYIAFGNPARNERLAAWTFFGKDNARTPYRGAGGVLRCKPDGSDVHFVARGLERPGGLVFDRYWNLFTSDDRGDTAAYWHVTPHAYFGHELAPMLEGTRSTLAYCDDEPLPVRIRRHLLSASNKDLTRLSLTPRGASFQATQTAIVPAKGLKSLTVDCGGRIFGILASGELVMYTVAGDALAPYDLVTAKPDKLWEELSNPSWQRRYRAHLELTRRGGALMKEANQRLLEADRDDPALHHLIWLAARSNQGSLHLLGLIDHPDARVRVQVIRALTEFPEQLRDEPIFTKALIDEHAQVQHAALSAYFSPKIAWSQPARFAIERGAACSKDAYLRQAAALLLAEKATRSQLEALCSSNDPAKRRAGVLAIGYRLTLPPATRPLPPHLPLARLAEEACVIEYADGKVDLRERGRIGSYTVAEHWKADKRPADEELLFKALRRMRQDEGEAVRGEGVYFTELMVGKE